MTQTSETPQTVDEEIAALEKRIDMLRARQINGKLLKALEDAYEILKARLLDSPLGFLKPEVTYVFGEGTRILVTLERR